MRRLDQCLKKKRILYFGGSCNTRRTVKEQPAPDCSSARQRQRAVTAYFSSEQLPLFVFASRTVVLANWIEFGLRDIPTGSGLF